MFMKKYETIRVDKTLPLPYKKREDDAGHDLYALESGWIWPFQTKTIKSNHKILIEKGDKGLVFARSGIRNRGLLIEGVIDAGYTGIIGIMTTNCFPWPRRIKKGERICQILFNEPSTILVEVEKFSKTTNRGADGGLWRKDYKK